jgi:chromosome segregation ATPase
LLNGSALENITAESNPDANNEDPEGSRELLIRRRRNYLDNLDKSFKRLDNELFSIEKLRAELTHARGEILVKKDEAQKKIRLLEEEGKRFLDEVKRIEAELESSVKEEGLLIKEFKELVGKVESSLEISDEMDHILFTHLTAAESRGLPGRNPAPVPE